MKPPAPGGAALHLDGIDVRFGGTVALAGVSMSIPARPGVSAIIGPNGAGKTTLFNVMTGVVAPSAGRLFVSGQDVTSWRADRIFRARVSRTFQGVRLFAHLTVMQNVLLAARSVLPARPWQHGGQAGAHAARCLAAVGIDGGLWPVLPGRLTLLQQRLVEIARALSAFPVVLLLDEPAAGLNTAEKQLLAGLIGRIAADSACRVVVVEHDMKLVMTLAERIWVMNFGRLLAEGTPDEVQSDPAVVEAYLGLDATA